MDPSSLFVAVFLVTSSEQKRHRQVRASLVLVVSGEVVHERWLYCCIGRALPDMQPLSSDIYHHPWHRGWKDALGEIHTGQSWRR